MEIIGINDVKAPTTKPFTMALTLPEWKKAVKGIKVENFDEKKHKDLEGFPMVPVGNQVFIHFLPLRHCAWRLVPTDGGFDFVWKCKKLHPVFCPWGFRRGVFVCTNHCHHGHLHLCKLVLVKYNCFGFVYYRLVCRCIH